jgi:hypothetical protein
MGAMSAANGASDPAHLQRQWNEATWPTAKAERPGKIAGRSFV